MLFAPDRCVFKITVFSCVVVSVFSDGRMGFYRAGWRCCVAGCMACGRGAFCLPVCFRGPGGFFFFGGGWCRGRLLSAAYGGGRFAVLVRECGYAMGLCACGDVPLWRGFRVMYGCQGQGNDLRDCRGDQLRDESAGGVVFVCAWGFGAFGAVLPVFAGGGGAGGVVAGDADGFFAVAA